MIYLKHYHHYFYIQQIEIMALAREDNEDIFS
jgi:hypothetical protein